MDTITHITLGACVGEAVLGKDIGKRALFWGVFAQNLPDIDALSAVWFSPSENLLVHRGITHSFLFIALIAPTLGILFKRYHPKVPLGKIVFFFAFQLLLHDFLDVCNSYGTGLLEPFSHERFTFNLLYVFDPFFSLSLFIAFIVLLRFRATHASRPKWVLAGIIPCVLYTGIAAYNKWQINKQIEKTLASQTSYFTTPTPFNSLLWYTVAKKDFGYQIGYRSVFDKGATVFHYVAQRGDLLQSIQNKKQVHDLIQFSRGFYTVDNRDNLIRFNVLRFGQIMGWEYPNAEFTFHFYLTPGYDNHLVMQRGRFSGWNLAKIRYMLNRMAGVTTTPNTHYGYH
ncbi:MAG: metal-dependent hydrolase [Siphonobacter sp.]